jgi:hypothetical protein
VRSDVTPNFRKEVGVLPVPDGDGDPRISLHILELAQFDLGVDHNVVLVAVDPHHVRLDLAAREKRGDRREVPALSERLHIILDHHAEGTARAVPRWTTPT